MKYILRGEDGRTIAEGESMGEMMKHKDFLHPKERVQLMAVRSDEEWAAVKPHQKKWLKQEMELLVSVPTYEPGAIPTSALEEEL